jgi:hypothetical protein
VDRQISAARTGDAAGGPARFWNGKFFNSKRCFRQFSQVWTIREFSMQQRSLFMAKYVLPPRPSIRCDAVRDGADATAGPQLLPGTCGTLKLVRNKKGNCG